MWIFYFLFWTAVRARGLTSTEEPLYKKIGDTVVLTPDSEENPITNIRWLYGNDVAMWYRFGGEPLFFRQFKDRGSLDISTGEMTITGLTRDDSGIYTVEINGKETSETELLVISPVPKPTLYILCDPEKTYCVLTCSGSITDTEPVTYWWTAGGKRWPSTKEHKITKENKEEWFSCTLENPISSIGSEEVSNPFMEIIRGGDQTWLYILMAVFLVVCIIIIIIYLIHKHRKGLKPLWQYERRSGGWRDFRETTDPLNECSVTSDKVEKQYQKNPHGKMLFTVNENEYELDFNKMIQTHLKTKTKRKVRRVMLPPECQDVGVSSSDSLV